MTDDAPATIASDALVLLAGPSGSGKSTWAAHQFRSDQIVSIDALRATVGFNERDQRAGTDAFDVAALIIERRLKRGLLTVVDSLGTDPKQRKRWLTAAEKYQRPSAAIVFDVPDAQCRKRNKARDRPVPSKVLTAQLKRWSEQRDLLTTEVDRVLSPGPVRVLPPALARWTRAADLQKEVPPMKFGLTISSFAFVDDHGELGPRLIELAREAESAGFESLWVMDHFIQIPQVGRQWDPMLESYTTLSFLASATSTIGLGALVTGITYRNIAHLGKIIATLDVLSGGRARCGLGAAWFDTEHRLYGYDFPPLKERYDRLEDALQLLPLMWGPGSPSFEGQTFSTDAATCYPRPLQERIPVLVGGSGEKKTLKLAARYADACNLFGEPDVIRHKVGVLHRHLADAGREPADVAVTQLSAILCATDQTDLDARVAALSPSDVPPEAAANRLMAGTTEDHIARVEALADAGVDQVIVSLADLALPGAIENFATVIDHFKEWS